MKIKYFTILLNILVFCQCSSATSVEKDQRCKQIGERANKLLLEYMFLEDTTFARLDTALFLIDSIICDCPKYYAGLSTSKLKILCLKKEYSEAISYTQTLNEKRIYPQNKSILLKRFYAMQSQYKGDTISRNKFIKEIVIELRDSVSNYSAEIDSVLQLPNVLDILKSDKWLIVTQYYYYRAQIEGVNKMYDELDSFQKRINGNQKFFNLLLKKPLEDDFMEFNGI